VEFRVNNRWKFGSAEVKNSGGFRTDGIVWTPQVRENCGANGAGLERVQWDQWNRVRRNSGISGAELQREEWDEWSKVSQGRVGPVEQG
jgi:hypothetical protein